jgi:hypothetical protein
MNSITSNGAQEVPSSNPVKAAIHVANGRPNGQSLDRPMTGNWVAHELAKCADVIRGDAMFGTCGRDLIHRDAQARKNAGSKPGAKRRAR